MPPRHAKKLSEVLNEVFRQNSDPNEKVEDRSDSEPLSEPPPPSVPPHKVAPRMEPTTSMHVFSHSSTVYPPQPCERCVRSKKICKGIAGARCENCKNLHQKCSNSTGPPRGRHAANAASSASAVTALDNVPSSSGVRPKRKAAVSGKGKSMEYDEDDGDDEEEDELELRVQPAQKKRRTGTSVQRSKLLKEVTQLESSIKKLQTNFVKELTKLQQSAATLASQVRELD